MSSPRSDDEEGSRGDLPRWLRDGTPADEPAPAPPRGIKGWFAGLQKWRRIMLAGAVLLLLTAIGVAAFEDFPRWIVAAANVAGFVLLAYGFAEAMRARRKG